MSGTSRGRERVAIVGMGGIFPDSPDLGRFWSLVRDGRTAAREVPPGRWLLDPSDAYDPAVGRVDRVYSTRGCFVEGFAFDPEGLDLDPGLVARLDPMVHLALHAARAAWRGAKTDRVDRSRVGVIFGNIVLPTESASSLARATLGRSFAEAQGLDPGPIEGFEPLDARVAGLPAGLVAKALGLGGTAYTLDAACASSLYALKLAADELLEGRADAMLAGGLSRPDSLYTQMGFAQLRALSPGGTPRPFEAGADGLVVGEGAGMFVLKRLADAVDHGDAILGVIAGAGLSNDVDGGLLAPQSEGQLRAMRAAYERAGWDPEDVDLIECHATGTPVGDAVEVASLRALWGDRPSRTCPIGSVKSNVGHALTAAGSAGLLKVLLALEHEILPPTANYDRPAPGLDLGPFRVLERAEPWERRGPRTPRRAALSGFGFGGINAHVLVEEWVPEISEGAVGRGIEPDDAPIAIVGLAAHFGRYEGLRAFQRRVLGANVSPLSRGERGDGIDHANRIDEITLPVDRFRIPPRELEEMLPQQSLALRLAAEAASDAGWDDRPRPRAGCIVGLGLDLNATNFHVRWSLLDEARRWDDQLGLGLDDEALSAWAGGLRDAFGPPLTANRTMGALGSIVASRVAREFRLGGPSFTVSAEEVSGLRALEVACGLLRRGELDEAIVGAVDLANDPRARRVDASLRPGSEPADGAAVLVLKRLDDAVREGDRIYAVVRGSGPAVRSGAFDYLDPGDDDIGSEPGFPGSATLDVGHSGAASGLASAVKAALALYQQVLPPTRDPGRPGPDGESATIPPGPRFWLRDRVDGPRRAVVGGRSVDGNSARVALESYEPAASETTPGRLDPIGPPPSALFAVEGDDLGAIGMGLDNLERLANSADLGVDALARAWWRLHPGDPSKRLAAVIVADDRASLLGAIATARRRVAGDSTGRGRPGDRVAFSADPLGRSSGLAFVFPGMGNHFEGMGRELSSYWPEILRAQDARNDRLRSQMAAGTYWDEAPPAEFADHRPAIFGQVSFGTFASDLLRGFGVRPDSAIGYSLGETTALFALGAWSDRDEMFRRFDASTLFRSDLAGPCDAARKTWDLPPDEPVDWVAGIVQAPADRVRSALEGIDRAYLLIANTDRQVVVGGQGTAVRRLVERVGARFHRLPTVSTVHCEVVRAVERSYHDLHLLTTDPPPGVRFYSGSEGRAYPVDRESAARSIAAHALRGVAFPRVIRQAYDDGVRGLVEVGPGGSCTRMIGDILGGRPHLAVAACPNGREPVASLLMVLARLIAERFPVDLASLYGREAVEAPKLSRTIRIQVGLRPFRAVTIPDPSPSPLPAGEGPGVRGVESTGGDRIQPLFETHSTSQRETRGDLFPAPVPWPSEEFVVADPLTRQAVATESARLGAHSAFLRASDGLAAVMARQVAFQMELIGRLADAGPIEAPTSGPRPALDRDQCLAFAVGRIGDVLGPDFAAIDAHPTRVRLPDEPLMLVDRIMTIEGEPRSMGSGRVVTEHDVRPDAWYLDSGRIPTCVAVESGQADLFLSAYLGIDFETKGLAVYRLLDAVVTFHRELPEVGRVIRYDIAIDHFFRQGDARLFRFRFEATVDGEPLMTMGQGCAGFFTAEALDAGQGVVQTALDRREVPGITPEGWTTPAPMAVESLDDGQVEALRRGDLASAFGPMFSGLPLASPMTLPGGLMRLVHRVPLIDPTGGRFGLGLIRGEADIRPDDWFMTCHFVDDRVMPGTLMYECCLHTLRIFLMRMGWVGEDAQVACQPVPGVASRLKCRGQVVESTRTVLYEVAIKEVGYRPEPYAIVDALMYADGKPIVEITDMSLRMTGLDRSTIERIWKNVSPLPLGEGPGVRDSARPSSPDNFPSPNPAGGFHAPHPRPLSQRERGDIKTPAYDHSKILAFAVGKPSEAFGKPYRVFDEGRVIARLPGPPYQFLDRIVEVSGDPWKMVAGPRALAEYDVPPDAWYFEADRQDAMPFAVLLEAALQPCGWLAAYVGSALTSDVDLSFRNLGGSAVRLAPIGREIGTLATSATLTKVSRSGGMIIQQYDFEMSSGSRPVYRGDTTFGFFSKAALANQVGIRDARPWDEPGSKPPESFDYPDHPPFPDRRWGMIDRVEEYHPAGGPHRLGFIKGVKYVDPSEWFFGAHFFQDPVCPGSLGLESFLQLLKVVAARRWGIDPDPAFGSTGLSDVHRWTYRGQILPTDRLVTVRAVVTEVDDSRMWLKADGFLDVDGRVIYGMSDFTLRAGRADDAL